VESNDAVMAIDEPNGDGSDDQLPQPVIAPVAKEDSHRVLPNGLKNESKIAVALFTVSAACVVVLGELKKDLNNPAAFGLYTSLSYISLISSVIMLLLILHNPNIRCL
ncbi:hypothetical protein MKX01_017143, partial [Papaver californicum]